MHVRVLEFYSDDKTLQPRPSTKQGNRDHTAVQRYKSSAWARSLWYAFVLFAVAHGYMEYMYGVGLTAKLGFIHRLPYLTPSCFLPLRSCPSSSCARPPFSPLVHTCMYLHVPSCYTDWGLPPSLHNQKHAERRSHLLAVREARRKHLPQASITPRTLLARPHVLAS